MYLALSVMLFTIKVREKCSYLMWCSFWILASWEFIREQNKTSSGETQAEARARIVQKPRSMTNEGLLFIHPLPLPFRFQKRKQVPVFAQQLLMDYFLCPRRFTSTTALSLNGT